MAAAYERHRPGYPDGLVDQVLDHARRPVRSALEIGAGTGKATRLFAARGIAVTATDPDTAMLAEPRQHVPTAVTTVTAAFEGFPLGVTYDLVFATASLHWTRPEGRWTRVATLLERDGVFAAFGGQLQLADPDVEVAVRAARAPFLGDDGVPSADGTPTDAEFQWPGTELDASELFDDVRQSVIERLTTMSAADYVAHLGTISAYLELPLADRLQVFDRTLAVLPAQVLLAGDLTSHVARKSSSEPGARPASTRCPSAHAQGPPQPRPLVALLGPGRCRPAVRRSSQFRR